MPPRTAAVLYPNRWIGRTAFFKTSLLLWDHVDIISPSDHQSLCQMYSDKRLARAAEILLRLRTPDAAEQETAEARIRDLASAELSDSFFFADGDAAEGRDDTLSANVWTSLKQLNVVGRSDDDRWSRFRTRRLSAKLGLAAMAIVADTCAGATKVTVTENVDTYATLVRETAVRSTCDPPAEYETLVNVSLRLLNADTMTLGDICRLREGELQAGGGPLTGLRRNYHAAVERRVNRLTEARHPADTTEIERLFDADLEADLRELNRELRNKNKRVALSAASSGCAAFLAAGHLPPAVAPMVSLIAGSAAFELLKEKLDGLAKSRRIERQQPMSYLVNLTKEMERNPRFSRYEMRGGSQAS